MTILTVSAGRVGGRKGVVGIVCPRAKVMDEDLRWGRGGTQWKGQVGEGGKGVDGMSVTKQANSGGDAANRLLYRSDAMLPMGMV